MVSLGPAHYHCPAHYLSWKLTVVRGLGWGPVALSLDQWSWIIGGILPCPMPGLPHLVPHRKPEILWRYPGVWICGRDWDKTTKAPLFLYSFYFVMHLLHFLSYLLLVCDHQSVLVGALLQLLRLYLVFTCLLGCVYISRVGAWSVDRSILGRLSGWLMNLVAPPMRLGFSSASSAGCLCLRSATFQHLVLPLVWSSTNADNGDFSLITL